MNLSFDKLKETVLHVIQLTNFEDEIGVEIFKEYLKSEDFVLAFRYICIQNDLKYLNESEGVPTYDVNNCTLSLDTECEINVFWCSLSIKNLFEKFLEQQNKMSAV